MKQPRRSARIAGLAAVAAALAGFASPRVECLAPGGPGSGWDFTCRTVGRLLQEIGVVDRPVQVINMPGGIGAVAFSHVAENRSRDAGLLVATSTVGITQIAQRRYPGDADRMRWVAMLGADTGVVLVRPDSPLRTLDDLFAALKANPAAVVTGGTSGAGGYDHLRLLLLARAAGMSTEELRRVRWVQFDGGTAVPQLIGGHVGVVSLDIGEISGFVEAGQVRALGVLSEERLPAPFAALPTAREQGLDVVGINWRGFYTGGRVPDAAYAAMVDSLKRLYDDEKWQQAMRQHGLQATWRGGPEFDAFVRQHIAQLRGLSQELGVVR